MIKRTLLPLFLFLLTSVVGLAANSYGNLTLKSSDANKGLVYVTYFRIGDPTPYFPELPLFQSSSTASYKGNKLYGVINWAGWAQPCRGYAFAGWDTQAVDSVKADSNNAYLFYSYAEDLSTSSSSPTKLTAEAKWEDATKYSVTYLRPENGTYSVTYSYLKIADGTMSNGSESYNISSSSADKNIISYEADIVTLSTTLSSFLGWYEVDNTGNKTLLSTEPKYVYSVSKNSTITALFDKSDLNPVCIIDGGVSTEFESLSDAITKANTLSSNPTIKLLDNVIDIDSSLTLKKSMTLDLNGKTLSGSADGLMTINAVGQTVTIVDSGSNGIISLAGSSSSCVSGINILNGSLKVASGNIHAENTSSSPSSSATAINVANGCSLSILSGAIEVSAPTNAFAVHVSSGAKADIESAIISSSTTIADNAYGVFAEGETTIGLACKTSHESPISVHITAKSSTTNAVGVYSTGSTIVNAADVSAIPGTQTAYAVLCAGGSCILNGGHFAAKYTGAMVDVIETGGSLMINGGYYVFLKDLQRLISDNHTFYDVPSDDALYADGYRYFVDSFDADVDVAMIDNVKYHTLTDALYAAKTDEIVILINNCRLDEAVTIPAGVTLLVPCDSEYTPIICDAITAKTYSEICAYKTITMMPGSSINVEGVLSLAARQLTTNTPISLTGGGPSSVNGYYGCIDMSRGGKITLQSGSAMYAWGYIIGQDKDQGDNSSDVGTIHALDGSKVYEGFVVGDWRGGGKTACLGSDPTYKVFPFSQYYIPNIEVPLTINYGATEYAVISVSGGKGEITLPIEYISSTDMSLFKVASESSSVTKRYDATADRQCYDFEGETAINAINIDAGSDLQVESSAFVLPITSNMSLKVNGVMDINYDVALIPGSVLEVAHDAVANINGNTFVYDTRDWDKYVGNYYYTTLEGRPTAHNSLKTWTSKEGLASAKLTVDGTLNVKGNLCSTNSGADVVSSDAGIIVFDAAPENTVTYQVLGSGDAKTDYKVADFTYNDVTYWAYCTPVSATAAQLRNADGSVVATDSSAAGTTYYYSPYTYRWGTEIPTPTGICNTTTSVSVPTETFSVNGMKLNAKKKGVNIIKMSDGTTKKVIF